MEKPKCEAKYGIKQCENYASRVVTANGSVYNLCNDCAKGVTKQEKANR